MSTAIPPPISASNEPSPPPLELVRRSALVKGGPTYAAFSSRRLIAAVLPAPSKPAREEPPAPRFPPPREEPPAREDRGEREDPLVGEEVLELIVGDDPPGGLIPAPKRGAWPDDFGVASV
jgi:hypothetical protein